MSKLDKVQRSFASAALRRVSHLWPGRSEAERASRVSRGVYQCGKCKVEGKRANYQMDHIDPVKPISGDNGTLDEEAARLLVYKSGWMLLCKSCHATKTATENAIRRENRKKGK